MEQMQASATVPHIVQVYQSSITSTKQNPQIIHISHPPISSSHKIYEDTITSEVSSQQIQSQIVMSCPQTLQNLQTPMQSQVIQNMNISSQLQFTSHVILPSVFKQHMLVDGTQQHYYGQYEFVKDQPCNNKLECCELTNAKILKSSDKLDSGTKVEGNSNKKRSRSTVPNPESWACNVRKVNHQKGQAYINTRGKYVPEKKVQTTKNCLTSCIYKCGQRINDTDRENIFKAFYTLSRNEKRHFLLNTTERNTVKSNKNDSRRKYSLKYSFIVRSIRYTVCKNFYLGTLAISQKPVYNVHSGKSDMNIPKPDGRGLSEKSCHPLPLEDKERVRKHIMSFKTENGKPIKQFSDKKQFLEANLGIKQMHNMYVGECSNVNVMPVKESMYRKIFKRDFNLHFGKNKNSQPLCGKCKGVIKKTES